MDINPRISALSVFMQQTLERVNATEQASQDGLLFLGNWHDAVPRMLVQDPALDPLAWGTWLVLKTHTVPNAPMAMPTYDRIAEQLKCSRTLLDKQLTTLRIARWLSSCTRVRGSGRFKGNVYALHDEPITLADALHLDPGYLTFLQDAQKHQNEDIRDLAERALSTVGHVIDKGMDITAPTSTLDRMAQRFAAANEIRPTEIDLTLFSTFGNRVHTIDSVTYAVRNRVQEMDSVTNTGDRVEKTDTVMPCNPVQNLESVTGSSSNIYNNYKYINTTTTKIPRENNDLVYPKSLTSDEQGIVRLYLQRLIPDLAHQHQDL
ncbi:MAG: STY4528 family pathogenicity island replication protein, partial [Gammaproteobacteria bacterium]|nr:STY4528 family pathogenicity island replication protein [Gammaproteobacteria bacterium]